MCIFCKKSEQVKISIDDYQLRDFIKQLTYDYLDVLLDKPRTEVETSNFRYLIENLDRKITSRLQKQNVDNVKEYVATEGFIDLVVEKINRKQIR